MWRGTCAVDPVSRSSNRYLLYSALSADIGCACLFCPVVIFAMGNSSFECEYRAPRCAVLRCADWGRRTLTILLFYVCTAPWTRLKVSQQSGGSGTWFKTGTISRGIALRRLTSAVCMRARSVWRSLSLFLFFSLSLLLVRTFSKMPSYRMWVVAPCALPFDFHHDVRTALLSATIRDVSLLTK